MIMIAARVSVSCISILWFSCRTGRGQPPSSCSWILTSLISGFTFIVFSTAPTMSGGGHAFKNPHARQVCPVISENSYVTTKIPETADPAAQTAPWMEKSGGSADSFDMGFNEFTRDPKTRPTTVQRRKSTVLNTHCCLHQKGLTFLLAGMETSRTQHAASDIKVIAI